MTKEREKEKRRSLSFSLVSRVNSIFNCLASRHSRLRQGSKIDYSSITLRLVPSFTPPSRVRHAAPSSPGSASIAPTSTSLLSPLSSHRVHLDPSGAHPPLPIPSPSSSRSVFVSSLSLLRYRVPISGPLGFTWRALMTSRNERVPPPSNKRLFHVPMLILRESSRLQLPFHLLFLLRHLPFLRTSRYIRCVYIYEIKMCEKNLYINDMLICLILKHCTCHDASSLLNHTRYSSDSVR